MLTQADLIQAATDAGYGDEPGLRTTFVSWQKAGLVGLATSKETGRRGGAGLWHPIQRELWLLMLGHRAKGIRLSTLANLPVGLWLLDAPGIELDQVQRAFAFWFAPAKEGRRPIGDRSLTSRVIDAMVDRIADPSATRAAKRGLRDVLRIGAQTMPEGVREVSFVEAALPAMFPGSGWDARQRQFATSMWRQMQLQLLTMNRLEVLVLETDSVQALWTWAQRQIARTLPEYVLQDQLRLAALPEIGRLFNRPDLSQFVNSACSTLALMLGVGLAINAGIPPYVNPEGYEQPPSLSR